MNKSDFEYESFPNTRIARIFQFLLEANIICKQIHVETVV